jgi:hypothetical protein
MTPQVAVQVTAGFDEPVTVAVKVCTPPGGSASVCAGASDTVTVVAGTAPQPVTSTSKRSGKIASIADRRTVTSLGSPWSLPGGTITSVRVERS